MSANHMRDIEQLNSARIAELYRRHLSKGRAKVSDVFGTETEVAAQGAWVETLDGQRYLNAGGYGVLLLGARHPYVEAAVIKQIQTNPIASRILLEPQAALAAQALCRVVPKGLAHVHFAGSGTEATEAAIKLARTLGKTRLITTQNGYHGKTIGALSVTANPLYQNPFLPLLANVSTVPFGDSNALEMELKTGPQACVILEPIQGEGGVRIPPAGYLQQVKELCQRYGALLVFDEIQSGMGRTGRWWAADREGVTPDIMLVGKGLSGGIVPVSAMVATPEAFAAFNKDPFIHTSTFSGAPIAMAAARAAVEAIEAEDLVFRSAQIGEVLLSRMKEIVQKHCDYLVEEVRGAGLLIGVEMKGAGFAGALLAEMIERHVLVNYSLNAGKVLRFTPPAIMTDEEVSFLLNAFDGACAALANQYTTVESVGAC
ncbi:aspartate aminotransferase family protein [Rheinheimera sp. 4Y26]|uniref:aspartate aminotransferase family protein n=1 Tax=Rheinheimera sp. 4Y26 TaxID=2977811 RepID=UPI0021B136F6|nr:aminotransferase class III-fold pyridoxal phosphate-dependent enzyme [Rheinheimera sp. 4Y26]MCT6700356.1 aminotransferase class III-fold pyridoxal phosphate-dependent enzyme [Rheinheimera sp. 4Y26]